MIFDKINVFIRNKLIKIKDMKKELEVTFKDLDTVLNKEYFGKVSDKFILLANDTKEDIKNKKQIHENLTNEISLEIDKAFDEYLESK